MIREGKVFGHKVSEKGIVIDKSGLKPLKELPRPRDVKGLQNFVGHVGFYRRFIKNLTNLASPLSHLLQKDVPFIFDSNFVLLFNN
jgi:hypothetical protein